MSITKTITPVMLVPGTNGVPYIVDPNGLIGGVLTEYSTGDKELIVIKLVSSIDFVAEVSKNISIKYVYNKNLNLWSQVALNIFKNGNEMTVDNSDYMSSETGLPCPPTDPYAVPTYQYLFPVLALPMVQAIQNQIIYILNQPE